MRYLIGIIITLISIHSNAGSVLNGVGQFEQLGELQFLGALYSKNPYGSLDKLLADDGYQKLEIRIVKPRIFAKQFRQWWIDGVAINNSPSVLEEQIDHFSYFTNLFNFRLLSGDQIVIERKPNHGVDIIFNDKVLGHVKADQFFRLLLSGWLGDISLSTNFRNRLLAAGEVDQTLVSRFDNYSPSQERIDLFASSQQTSNGEAPAEEGASVKAASVSDATARVVKESKAVAQVPVKRKHTKQKQQGSKATTSETATKVAAIKATAVPAERLIQAASEKLSKLAPTQNVEVDSAKANIELANSATSTADVLDKNMAKEAFAPTKDIFDEKPEVANILAQDLLLRQHYINNAIAWTNKHSRYPRRALKMQQQGRVVVSVLLDQGGNVQDVTILEKSKYSLLNGAAVRAVKKASPFPPPPQGEDSNFNLTVPIQYKLVADLGAPQKQSAGQEFTLAR